MSEQVLPEVMVRGLSSAERRVAGRWFSALSDSERATIRALARAPASAPDDASLRGVTVTLGGVWIGEDEAETRRELQEWEREYFEFLVNNPGPPPRQPFHICRAHPAARAVTRDGLLPASFACPVGSTSCPMRATLAARPGRSLRLRAEVVVVGSSSARAKAELATATAEGRAPCRA